MIEYKIDAIPYSNKDLDKWRENFVGVQTLHEPTNLLIFGAVDDVWINKNEELIVVDYKATSKKTEVSLDADWQMGYKRQLEIYQWLLRQNDFKVNDTGYFVYTNGNAEAKEFGDKLEFKTKVISYKGSDNWVDNTIIEMKKCLDGDMPPVGVAAMGGDCDYCAYARARTELALEAIRKNKK
jgi:CRISPR/Cas system-associated exonuclease Cas4 (RecB family)